MIYKEGKAIAVMKTINMFLIVIVLVYLFQGKLLRRDYPSLFFFFKNRMVK